MILINVLAHLDGEAWQSSSWRANTTAAEAVGLEQETTKRKTVLPAVLPAHFRFDSAKEAAVGYCDRNSVMVDRKKTNCDVKWAD